jgi:hypothetical protein
VVDMGDDGDIAYRLAHRRSVPSLLGQIWNLRSGMASGGHQVGNEYKMNGHTVRQLLFYQHRKSSIICDLQAAVQAAIPRPGRRKAYQGASHSRCLDSLQQHTIDAVR